MIDLTVSPMLLAGAALAVTVGSLLAGHAGDAEIRAHQLQGAGQLLQAHLGAVEAFCDAPDATDSLRRTLLDISDAMENEIFAKELLADFHEHIVLEGAPVEAPSFAELSALQKSSPETAAIFLAALTSGMLSAFMRWPSCAVALQDSLRYLADPREQFSLAATLSRLVPSGGFNQWSSTSTAYS